MQPTAEQLRPFDVLPGHHSAGDGGRHWAPLRLVFFCPHMPQHPPYRPQYNFWTRAAHQRSLATRYSPKTTMPCEPACCVWRTMTQTDELKWEPGTFASFVQKSPRRSSSSAMPRSPLRRMKPMQLTPEYSNLCILPVRSRTPQLNPILNHLYEIKERGCKTERRVSQLQPPLVDLGARLKDPQRRADTGAEQLQAADHAAAVTDSEDAFEQSKSQQRRGPCRQLCRHMKSPTNNHGPSSSDLPTRGEKFTGVNWNCPLRNSSGTSKRRSESRALGRSRHLPHSLD